MTVRVVGYLRESVPVPDLTLTATGAAALTVETALEQVGIPLGYRYCVVCDGRMVNPEAYASTTLNDDSQLRVIPLIGGG